MKLTPVTDLLPRFTDAQLATARQAAIRHVAELRAEKAITEDDAYARIDRLTQHNVRLSAEDRNALTERLIEAVQRIAHIQSDFWDPAEGNRDDLELAADHDAEGAVRELDGGPH